MQNISIKKSKTIKIKDYFQIVNPTYTYLKIIPDTSIRNYSSENIAKTFSFMYKSINRRIYKEEKNGFTRSYRKYLLLLTLQRKM